MSKEILGIERIKTSCGYAYGINKTFIQKRFKP